MGPNWPGKWRRDPGPQIMLSSMNSTPSPRYDPATPLPCGARARSRSLRMSQTGRVNGEDDYNIRPDTAAQRRQSVALLGHPIAHPQAVIVFARQHTVSARRMPERGSGLSSRMTITTPSRDTGGQRQPWQPSFVTWAFSMQSSRHRQTEKCSALSEACCMRRSAPANPFSTMIEVSPSKVKRANGGHRKGCAAVFLAYAGACYTKC